VPPGDRDQLAALLAGFAQRNGLYYSDTTPRAQRISNGRDTLVLTMQRKLTNGRPWAEIEVRAVGDGPALITFVNPLDTGVVPDANEQRGKLMGELRGKWPASLEIPLLPDGGIPRREHLRRTAAGLRIDPAQAARYHLTADSPLVAR
jgi:hypothetical protein